MKKVLALSLVLVLALSGMAVAETVVGHDGSTSTYTPTPVDVVTTVPQGVKEALSGAVAIEGGDADYTPSIPPATASTEKIDAAMSAYTTEAASTAGRAQDVNFAPLGNLKLADNSSGAAIPKAVFGVDVSAVKTATGATVIDDLDLLLLNINGGLDSYGSNCELYSDAGVLLDELPASGNVYVAVANIALQNQHEGSVFMVPFFAAQSNADSGLTGGGGGCNAGLSAFAGLAALAGFFFLKRK